MFFKRKCLKKTMFDIFGCYCKFFNFIAKLNTEIRQYTELECCIKQYTFNTVLF